jgi:microcystin degradation protein MlrC
MRIAIGGIMHESNTVRPLPTDRRRFEEGSLARGEALLPVWRDAHHEMGGFIAGAERFGYELAPTVMAWATPAGPVEDEVIDEVVGEIAEGCHRASVDGLLLALHGAMVSRRHHDADGEVLRRLRTRWARRSRSRRPWTITPTSPRPWPNTPTSGRLSDLSPHRSARARPRRRRTPGERGAP